MPKPCPFCGSTNIELMIMEKEEDDGGRYANVVMECQECFANQGSTYDYVDQAVDVVSAKWDNRV